MNPGRVGHYVGLSLEMDGSGNLIDRSAYRNQRCSREIDVRLLGGMPCVPGEPSGLCERPEARRYGPCVRANFWNISVFMSIVHGRPQIPVERSHGVSGRGARN